MPPVDVQDHPKPWQCDISHCPCPSSQCSAPAASPNQVSTCAHWGSLAGAGVCLWQCTGWIEDLEWWKFPLSFFLGYPSLFDVNVSEDLTAPSAEGKYLFHTNFYGSCLTADSKKSTSVKRAVPQSCWNLNLNSTGSTVCKTHRFLQCVFTLLSFRPNQDK